MLEHSSQVQSDVWIEALEQLFELYGDENGEYEESVYQNAGFQSRLEQALAEMNNKVSNVHSKLYHITSDLSSRSLPYHFFWYYCIDGILSKAGLYI